MAIRSDETVANIAIILIHQADVMLHRLIERQKADFMQQGGIREQMSRARREYRSAQGFQGFQSTPRTPSAPRTSDLDPDPKPNNH